jgi:hypothetical protein
LFSTVFTTFHHTIVASLAVANTSSTCDLGILTLSNIHHSIALSICCPKFSTHSFAVASKLSLLPRIHFCKNVGVILSVSCFIFFPVGARACDTLSQAELLIDHSILGNTFLAH